MREREHVTDEYSFKGHKRPQVSSTNRYPCVVCSTEVRNQGICCDSCDRWCHLKCSWLSEEEFYILGNCNDSWYCPACCLPNFTTFFETSTTTDLDVTASNLPIYPTSVSLVHLNIRSKLNEISLLVSNHNLNVLTLSETWLDESICDAEVSFPGYNLLRQDRNRHGGGVAIFISASIRFTHRSDLQ